MRRCVFDGRIECLASDDTSGKGPVGERCLDPALALDPYANAHLLLAVAEPGNFLEGGG